MAKNTVKKVDMQSSGAKNQAVGKVSKADAKTGEMKIGTDRSGRSKMFETRNDMDQEVRGQMVELLNQRLADIFDLYSQTKQAHWNVKGRDFYQLHLLFDELAEGIEDYVDMLAERVTALGGFATGTVRMAAGSSTLPEFTAEEDDEMQYVSMMADRYAAVAKNVRADADTADENGDLGTSDLLTDIIRQLDKSLYFLESHIQR